MKARWEAAAAGLTTVKTNNKKRVFARGNAEWKMSCERCDDCVTTITIAIENTAKTDTTMRLLLILLMLLLLLNRLLCRYLCYCSCYYCVVSATVNATATGIVTIFTTTATNINTTATLSTAATATTKPNIHHKIRIHIRPHIYCVKLELHLRGRPVLRLVTPALGHGDEVDWVVVLGKVLRRTEPKTQQQKNKMTHMMKSFFRLQSSTAKPRLVLAFDCRMCYYILKGDEMTIEKRTKTTTTATTNTIIRHKRTQVDHSCIFPACCTSP